MGKYTLWFDSSIWRFCCFLAGFWTTGRIMACVFPRTLVMVNF
jgi:hypothetical protein